MPQEVSMDVDFGSVILDIIKKDGNIYIIQYDSYTQEYSVMIRENGLEHLGHAQALNDISFQIAIKG